MGRYLLTLPDDSDDLLKAVKHIAKSAGGKVEKAPVATKKPRTQLQQDFVDAYKEALAAERGEVQLQTIEEFLAEWKSEKENGSNTTRS